MDGREVYIVGCGPSMREFPWDRLKGLLTIAVNGAILDVPEPTYFLTACSAFATRAHRSGFWGTKARKVMVMGKDHKNYDKVQPFIDDEQEAISKFDLVVSAALLSADGTCVLVVRRDGHCVSGG